MCHTQNYSLCSKLPKTVFFISFSPAVSFFSSRTTESNADDASRPGASRKMSRKEVRQAAVQVPMLTGQGPQAGTFLVPCGDGEWHSTISCNQACPYCKKKHAMTPSGKFQAITCRAAPFNHWLGYSLYRRNILPTKTTEAERNLWTFRCSSCGRYWRNMKALAAHRTGCVDRRAASGLPAPPVPTL